MQRKVAAKTGGLPLFRRQAMTGAGARLFGSVTVIVPPSGLLALSAGAVVLLLLGVVAWSVEVPMHTRAVGVLMPPGGLLDINADGPGRVALIHVREGQAVQRGDVLVSITASADQFANRQLQSLRSELALVDEARSRQQAIEREQLIGLAERIAAVEERLTVARQEYTLQKEHAAILGRRFTRRSKLAAIGSISADMLDGERGELLQAEARLATTGHAILRFEQDRKAATRERKQTGDESARLDVLHDLERQRLQRRIAAEEYRVDRQIMAGDPGIIARINVQPGAAIRPGESLLKMYRQHRHLEAWLYVSSARAGFVRIGQTVRLRLDAYPHEMFGTTAAIVMSVSRIAVVPAELRIPLALGEPVFEVRARIDRSEVYAYGASWPLTPGTSFRADIEQRRIRLYRWLMRGLAGDSVGQRG